MQRITVWKLRNILLEHHWIKSEITNYLESNLKEHFILKPTWGFPGGAVVKNPPANAGDIGSSTGPGRSHMPRSN